MVIVPVTAAAVEEVAGHWKALPVTLSGFGIFPAPAAILYAAPIVTRALLARHEAIQVALPELQADPHYRPNAWVPHVTLTGALRDPTPAFAALLSLWRPLNGVLDRVDLVRFRPAEVLQSYVLPLLVLSKGRG